MAKVVPQGSTSGAVIYRRLLGYVRPHWKVFLLSIMGLLLVAATEAGFAMLIKPMIDGTFVEFDAQVIKYTPIVLIVLFLVRAIATFAAGYAMAWVARNVIYVLRGQMFEHLLRLPVSFYDTTPSATLLSKLIYNVEQVARASTEVITVLVRDTFHIIGLLAWLFYLNWKLAAIMLIGAPLVAHIINTINRRFRRYSSRIQESMGDVSQIAEEAIEGQRVVKTFGGRAYEEARFARTNGKNRRLNLRLEATSVASVPMVQLVAAFAVAGVLHVALQDVQQEKMSVGAFMSFIAAMMMTHSPMKRLTKVTASLQRGIAAADSVFALVDTPTEVDEGKASLQKVRGEVTFRDVRFAYSEDKGEVLSGVSFTAEAGKSVAFVGRSGSGKSTLVSLLPRFYDVDAGSISVDGHDVRDIPLESLRDQIALVSQHITLFNDTIANNIAYGRLKDASREQIVAAAVAAHAMEFIDALPEGLDTMVGENGVLLSGGQRQRLAIARALLKDAPILILDEATSALDNESERHIQEALEVLMRERTTLVIAHRLSTIEGVDKIIVMERGQIVESGSHQELLATDGHYAALHRLQFRD